MFDSTYCILFHLLLSCSVVCGCCSIDVIFGDPVQLDCNSSTSLDTTSSVIDTVEWQHQYAIIIDHSSNTLEMRQGRYYSRIAEDKSSALLEIQAAMIDDSGLYTCLLFFERESSLSVKIGFTSWILSIQAELQIFPGRYYQLARYPLKMHFRYQSNRQIRR